MHLPKKLLIALVMFSAGAVNAAENLDGSVPLLCAATEAIGCKMDEECVKGSATVVNLPIFIRIDAEKKRVQNHQETSAERISKIISVHKEENTVVFFGVDEGQAWSVAVDQASGQMTASASADGVGYIVFGACTPL